MTISSINSIIQFNDSIEARIVNLATPAIIDLFDAAIAAGHSDEAWIIAATLTDRTHSDCFFERVRKLDAVIADDGDMIGPDED